MALLVSSASLSWAGPSAAEDKAENKAEDKAEPKAATRSTNPLVYVGFGVAGAGLITGALFGADSLQATSTAKETCVDGRCPPSSFEFVDQANRSAWISNISFGVAVVGLGVGIYGLMNPSIATPVEPPPAKKKKGSDTPNYHPAPPGISLNVGPGSVLLRGEF